jgi:hypothetical protein
MHEATLRSLEPMRQIRYRMDLHINRPQHLVLAASQLFVYVYYIGVLRRLQAP